MSKSNVADAGHHFIVGLRPSAALHPLDRVLLRDLKPAGVILYKSNFRHDLPYSEWLSSHAALVADVREVIGRDKLFIAIDHEGGRVLRTPPPVTRYAYARAWADSSRAVGEAMGIELASLGINLNFAPVLDVDSNPNNPVIGARAFSNEPDRVSAWACAFMKGMESQRVRACGKHFPGHGDTRNDSHYEMPVITASLDELRSRELRPFAAAIDAGIEMIMTSHVLFQALDERLPATLSRRIGHDLLRSELGFNGVIVSDDIGMHAVSKVFEQPESIDQFFSAGNDMLMIAAHWTDTERVRAFAQRLVSGRADGSLDVRALDRSRERIDAMLRGSAQNEVRALPAEVFQANAGVSQLFSDKTVEVI